MMATSVICEDLEVVCAEVCVVKAAHITVRTRIAEARSCDCISEFHPASNCETPAGAMSQAVHTEVIGRGAAEL